MVSLHSDGKFAFFIKSSDHYLDLNLSSDDWRECVVVASAAVVGA